MPRQTKGPQLYLRKRKGRQAVWHIRDGRAHEISTGCSIDDREGAEKRLAAYITRKWQPSISESDPSQIPIAEVLMHYARSSAPGHAAPALVGYHMDKLLGFWGRRTLADVRAQSCRDYVGWRTSQKWQGRTVSAGTSRRELETLQAAINVWHRESPLKAVPAVTLPHKTPARQRFLARNEVAALLRAARHLGHRHVCRFILIGLYTGTRHAAILSLRWLPSPDGGWIDVDKAIIHRKGFGERETHKRRSPARIPDRLMAHLRRWHRIDSAQGIVGVVTWGGKQLKKERRAWSETAKVAGLGPEVTPHVLRHTCATWALSSGMNYWDVAALLATSVQMIEATYGHHSPEFQTAAKSAFAGPNAGRK